MQIDTSYAEQYSIISGGTGIAENIAGSNFSTSFTYDTYGRLSTRTHPSGIIETMGYKNTGYLETISAGGATRYTVTGMNARQQLTNANYGATPNILSATYGFDAYGYPTSTATGSVQDYRYVFDAYTGNLSSRQNFKLSKSESFTYVANDKLFKVTGPQNLTMGYNINGNINYIGTTDFVYGNSTRPYQVTSVTSSTGIIPTTDQLATYTSFEKVSTLTEGVYAASFIYNSNNQRAKMTVTQSGTAILTRTYIGNSDLRELIGGITKDYAYIGGDAYTAPVVAINTYGTIVYYYLLRDYLGNITHVYNASTSTVQEYSFDAWGRRRNPTDWGYDLTGQPELFADRGFTSHEFLKHFNIYNMNGRLYDPLVGRFLSPDPYIQDPTSTQNLNRYSYCLNNPLKYNDPSGYTYLKYMDDTYGEGNYWHRGSGPSGSAGGGSHGGGGPGQGRNGTGLNGVYYDWNSGTYRSTDSDNGQVGWEYANNNSALPYSSSNSSGTSAEDFVRDVRAGFSFYQGSFNGKNYLIGSKGDPQVSRLQNRAYIFNNPTAGIIYGMSWNTNLFGDRYTGWNNPIGYSLPPLNPRDAISMEHDKGYDAFGAKGPKAVFTNGFVLPVDYKFIKEQYKLGFSELAIGIAQPNGTGGYFYQQGFYSILAGTAIGVPALLKTVFVNPYKIY